MIFSDWHSTLDRRIENSIRLETTPVCGTSGEGRGGGAVHLPPCLVRCHMREVGVVALECLDHPTSFAVPDARCAVPGARHQMFAVLDQHTATRSAGCHGSILVLSRGRANTSANTRGTHAAARPRN